MYAKHSGWEINTLALPGLVEALLCPASPGPLEAGVSND